MILDDYVEGLDLIPDDELLAAEDDTLDDNIDGDDDKTETPPEDSSVNDDDEGDDLSTDDNDDEGGSADETALAYFNYLKEAQVLAIPDDFQFDGTTDGINQALELTRQAQLQQVAESIWARLPDDFKPLLSYGLNGGSSLQAYMDAYSPLNYDELDIDDPITQNRVIKEYYKTMNPKFSDEKIDKMVARLSEIGDPKEEAEDAIDYLKGLKAERQQNLLESLEEQRQADIQRAQEESRKLSELIDGSKTYDNLRKGRLKNFILNPIQEDNQVTTEFSKTLDNILENPDHLVQLADILADYHPSKGFNFDRLRKQLKTDSVKNFKDLLQSKLDTKTKVKGGTQKEVKEDFDWDKFLST